MKLGHVALAFGSLLCCGLASPSAEAGQGCSDACTTNVGPPCVNSGGYGCVNGMCNQCTNDIHCRPNGICDLSTGVGVCTTTCPMPDAGALDSGPSPDSGPIQDSGPSPDSGPPSDAGAQDGAAPMDAASPVDAGPPDTGLRRDAMTTVTGGTSKDRDETFDEGGCGCSTSATRQAAASLGLATLVGLAIVLRRRR